jgi:hypothetical protein
MPTFDILQSLTFAVMPDDEMDKGILSWMNIQLPGFEGVFKMPRKFFLVCESLASFAPGCWYNSTDHDSILQLPGRPQSPKQGPPTFLNMNRHSRRPSGKQLCGWPSAGTRHSRSQTATAAALTVLYWRQHKYHRWQDQKTSNS